MVFKKDEDVQVRLAAAQALGQGASQWGGLAGEIIPELVTALNKDGDSRVREAAARVLGQGASQGGGLAGEIIPELVTAFKDRYFEVRIAAARAWREVAVKLVEQGKMKITEITGLFNHSEDGVVQAAVTAWKEVAVKMGNPQRLSMDVIYSYYALLLEKRRENQTRISDDKDYSREIFILKIYSLIEGKVDPDDVRYLGQIADATRNRDSLRATLDTIRGWAVDGSADAQNFFEGRVGQITSRNPKSGQDYVETDERDDVFIEATAGSFRQRGLLPIFTDRKFHPGLRARVMKSLAESGSIDPAFGKIEARMQERYLATVSAVYEETGLIITKKLADKIQDGELTVSDIKEGWPWIMVERGIRPYRTGKKSLRLTEIQFGDGGNALMNSSDFMRDVLNELPGKVIERPLGLPRKVPLSASDIPIFEVVDSAPGSGLIEGAKLNLSQPVNRYGRTLEFRENGKAIHFKFLKKGEEPELLSYEYDMMRFLRSRKDAWGLQGMYPEGMTRIGRIKIEDLPEEYLKGLQGKRGTIEVDTTDGYYTFMAYETDVGNNGNAYYTYLNDPDLSHEEFMEGLKINVHDRFVMARHGLFDMEMIELFHNQQNGQGRRYDWMVDIRNHQQTRHGAGRLNNITGATLYPNIRLSGPADFAGIRFVGDLMEDFKAKAQADNRISRLLNMEGKDKVQAEKFVQSALLGDALLSLALMIPTYYERRNELNYEKEKTEQETPLQRSLWLLFKEAQRAFTGLDDLPKEIMDLNISLMAKQMAFFLSDAYISKIPLVSTGTLNGFLQDIFPGAKLGIIEWRSWRGVSPQRGWDYTHEQHAVPSRDSDRTLTRGSRDLGYVNGFNPLQEFIKGMYVATTMMTVGGYSSLSDAAILDLTSSTKELKLNVVSTNTALAQNPGGIDFNPDLLELETQGVGQEFNLPALVDNLDSIQIEKGLLPVIINITPITTTLRMILGAAVNEEQQLTSVQ
jgi:hypothetical protein